MLHTTVANTLQLRPNASTAFLTEAPDLSRVERLTENDRIEVLGFLSVRPVHTVVMTSYIVDNGIESDLNRGTFYGYRNASGTLDGVALIGHSTLFEARTPAATTAFAHVARGSETPIHLIMSAGDAATEFWNSYSNVLTEPRLTCTELLFEVGFPFHVQKCDREIRKATAEDLIPVAEAQAEVAFIECGVDPLLKDRAGFLKRVMRRIEQGRVFVVVENGVLVFKADIVAQTGQTAYLEGVYVAPQLRGHGIGSTCLAQLSLDLLSSFDNVCLLSNVNMKAAHRSFTRAGYKVTDKCVTLFV